MFPTLAKTSAPLDDPAMLRLLYLALLPLLLAGCAPQSHAPYPEHWFAPADAATAPSWEILPQAAEPGQVILSKRNELGLLSNFAPTPFTYHNVRYASVEGFWQMMKYPEGTLASGVPDPRSKSREVTYKFTRAQVAQMSSFEAKRAGDLAEASMNFLAIDWVTFEGVPFTYRSQTHGRHYELIVDAMREKLRQNPEVQKVLLSTGNLTLLPDHHQSPDDPDEWRYYQIWMQLRSELQSGNFK